MCNYLKNTWYVAAWSEEVTEAALLGRKILDIPVVLYRDNAGEVVALTDRCPHRFAPLSMGKIVNGCVECPYHGLRFNGSGACVHNPHGDGRIPDRAKVISYPVAEKHLAIWIWMGDPAAADPASIPEFEFMEAEDYYIATGSMQVEGNYMLEVDNILDLSHIEFVHPIFSSPAVSRAEVTHEIDGETVWSKRDMLGDDTPPDFIREVFNVPEGPLDRWLHVHWQAPAYMALYAGGVAAGKAFEEGIVSRQAHWFTPETATSTHYFYAMTEPKANGPHMAEVVQQSIQALYGPFKNEDAPIIEAQQRNIGDEDFMAMKPIILNVDAAGMAARKIVDKKIQAESK
jgi:phenylpropionate dioxygenase-like ring-hydroxylating dioxygenase large terminal subunit